MELTRGSTTHRHGLPAEPESHGLYEWIIGRKPDRVTIRPLPHILVLWPTLAAALICWILMAVFHKHYAYTTRPAYHLGVFFMFVFVLNMIVLAFDFPRASGLAVLLAIASIIMALWLLELYKPGWVFGPLRWLHDQVKPFANHQFYFLIALALVVIYFIVFIRVRFLDYWEILPNEIRHHHGFLGDIEVFPAPQLKYDRQIPDMFELLLCGWGRLILHPTSETRAIVLDNVFGLKSKEARIESLLGVLEVETVDPHQRSVDQ